MRSSEPSATLNLATLASALRHFNWIEQGAIPVIMAIMETQPVLIVFILLSQAFMGTTQPWPLEAYTITLLFVALHWWALWVEHTRQSNPSPQRIQLLRVGGLLVASIVTLLTNLLLLTNLFAPIVMLIFITWAWKRGMDKTRFSLSDEDLVPTFRAGFLVLLFLFVLTVLLATDTGAALYSGVFVALGNAFSLFFFSGLLALSFTRIAIIRRDLARTSSRNIFDPTRAWLLVLTLAWTLLLAVVIGLESFSFQSIADFFSPLWTLLGIIVTFLLQVFFFLLSPLLWLFGNTLGGPGSSSGHRPTVQPPSHRPAPGTPPTIPAEALLIGRIALLLILVVLFILLIRLLLRRWQARQYIDDSEEEIREMLPIRTLLQRHQQQRHPQQERVAELEPLPPNSARARYRELLQTVAAQQETLTRRASETPAEYQARLLAQLQQHVPSQGEHAEPLDDAATLAALTDAYTRERYGGKSTQEQAAPYSTHWLTHFIQRLSGTSLK